MNLLITGVSGLVGCAAAREATRRGHRVTGIVGRYGGPIEGVTKQVALELSDTAAAERLVAAEQPDAIVNCAALSSPDACDANPTLAKLVNVALPVAFARWAAEHGGRLVHISSEQVFDGTRTTPYRADDPVSPINLYGWQKLESEQRLAEIAPKAAVTVRAPLLMGNSLGGVRSVHERLFLDWAAGRSPRLYTDELRQPCTGADLSAVLLDLAERRDLCGVFHWAGAELLSRYAMGVAVRNHFGLAEARGPLTAAARTDDPAVAKKRQACLALDVTPLATALKRTPPTFAEQLAQLHIPPAAQAWYSTR
jgi:dTDP-4-dehydrorhamnose reductase